MEEELRRNRKRPRKKITWRFYVTLAVVVVVFFLTAAGVSIYNFLGSLRNISAFGGEDLPKPKPGEKINILLLGIDVPVDGKGNVVEHAATRSDTIILATVDADQKTVNLISIPRDTKVEIPGRSGYDKVNAAHAFGGPELIMKTVQELLDVPVHYYIRTNVDGFSNIVDVLGGVNINVEKDMHYTDPWQDLEIDLKKGPQLLDGNKAMQYVRYRSDGDDITRIHRQQKFFAALADKLLSPGTIVRLPRLMSEITKFVDTNMDPSEMLNLAKLALGADASGLQMSVLPGKPTDPEPGKLSYWLPDAAAIARTMDKVYRDIDPEQNANVKVAVLNGTDRPGLASAVAQELSDKGFKVINTGNADNNNYKVTKVIDHTGDQTKIDTFAKVFDHGKLFHEADATGEADITVIIGADYQG